MDDTIVKEYIRASHVQSDAAEIKNEKAAAILDYLTTSRAPFMQMEDEISGKTLYFVLKRETKVPTLSLERLQKALVALNVPETPVVVERIKEWLKAQGEEKTSLAVLKRKPTAE